MKDNVLANIDIFCATVNKYVMIFGSICSICNSFCDYFSVLLKVAVVTYQLQLFYFFRNIKL